MNDLTEIALNALERAESADETDTGATETDGTENNENPTDGAGDNGETNTENDGGGEPNDADNTNNENDDSDESETDGEPDDSDDEPDKKKNPDEMTDEEFEEMAKKRGYAKRDDDAERKKAAEDDAKRRADAINSIPKPAELSDETWKSMPPVNRIIYANLPYISTQDKDGNIVKVKTPEQLPDDFEFKNEKIRTQFMNDLQAQENKAQQMNDMINRRVQESRDAQERQLTAQRIVNEVSALQKDGMLPTPKAQPNTSDFDTDPAVVLINKVLGYQAARAHEGVRLSVRDALTLYKNEHPDDFKQKETAKGDAERKTIAKKVAGNKKSADTTADKTDNKRKYYKYGMSTTDVLDRVLNDLD